MTSAREIWLQLQQDFSLSNNLSALRLAIYLAMGGVLALLIRFLYARFSGAVSDTESVTRVFPLLVLVTTAVIAVVKTSMALSLGLVGALSIVRFRAAIKDPEELAYLFFCIAVGLCLGAERPMLALALVVVAGVFILGGWMVTRGKQRQTVLLTISGSQEEHFVNPDDGILATLSQVVPKFTVQRCDLEDGQGQLRVLLGRMSIAETIELIAQLRTRFPDCQFSYVNVETTL